MASDRKKPMHEDELKALVQQELASAESSRAILLAKVTKSLEYYQGELNDIPHEVGRSGAVSLDLADTMGWMLPGIIRVFTASQHMALVEPVGAEDEEWAENATHGVNYVFFKENDGYRIIHSATWDSLLSGNGIVKTWYDEEPKKSTSFHSGLDEMELAELVSGDTVEVLQKDERQEEITGPDGQTVPYTVYDVKIERSKDYGCIRLECIAPEDFGIDADAKTCAEARFCYHRARKRSDLIEMGFARDEVEKIAQSTDWDTSAEAARNFHSHEHPGDPSTEIIDLFECYVKADINGDGISELVKVDYAGNKSGGTILDWQEWEDELPFDDVPCNPMPHRFEASSISDETIDVAQIKTVLLRQGLDNIYATSNPQRFVTGSIKNPEALFSPMFGETIFGEPGSTVTPMPIPFVADQVFSGLDRQDQVIERRTGVSRMTMSLDPEALQNQTATANQNARDAAYSQIELIARNQAELGWRAIFKKILKLEIRHRDKPREIRMRGQPVVVDPRHWNADMDVSINVGLGTGSRDRDMQILNQVKQDLMLLMDAAANAGYTEVAVQVLPHLLTTMQKFGESSGLHNPEMFYPEVTDEEVIGMQQMIAQQKQQPDPKLQAEQMKQQMEGQKLQLDMQSKQAEMQMKQMEMQARMETEREKAAAQIRREQAQMEADMQVRALDSQFKEKELMLKAQLEREKMAQERELKLLEMGLAADDTGEMDATMVSVKAASEKMVLQSIAALSAAVADLKAGATLPKRIVRDPVTGKAIGMETMGMEASKVAAAATNGSGTVQ